ncbi:GNAT family N-acetyltransferase [Undibacterium sp. SXout20W]|uniref:GNAT family N-acetyltransferase n=1 Tax=Undibacterium sp. SXout20W TaxID=3413051 RepID=UPI003BF1B5C9
MTSDSAAPQTTQTTQTAQTSQTTNAAQLSQLVWQCLPFAELSNIQLHRIFAARSAVFVLEQNCVYQDIDGKDPHCHHLIAWDENGDVAAYIRIVPAGLSFAEPSIGRVLSTQKWRGTGIGKLLLVNGIAHLRQLYPQAPIRIGAQAYLEKFYGSFGFKTVSDMYLEDDIPHVDMLLAA